MKRPVENYIVELNKGSVDLTILRNPRARRMTLRVDPKPGAATLVAPPFLDTRTAMRFVRENADWLPFKRMFNPLFQAFKIEGKKAGCYRNV